MNCWKNLHKYFLILAVILPLVGQEGEIIPLTKHIGFTLDAEENMYYKVFTDVSNFESAQFFEVNKNRIEARISFVEFTRIKVSRRAYTLKELTEVQFRLNQMSEITDEVRLSFRKNLTYLRTKEVLENIPTGQYVSVKHRNGKWIRGTLLSYRKERLSLQTPFAIKHIPISEMQRINYREEIISRPEWKLTFYGLAALLGFGLMESWNRQTNPDWGPKWHNRFTGAIFGLIAGAEVYETSMILLSKKTQFGLTPAELNNLNR
ncbi:MAG: hypothetical protein U9N31_01160 [Candidatus Marinimicrobia bacterium]|nr:hypothetical protein [Candidatus Neomarinimicrobiota bacterium]